MHLLHGHAGYAITRASLLADQPCSDDQQTLFVLQEVEQRIQPLSKMAYGICRSNLHHRLIGEPNFFPPPQESGSLCKQDHSLFRGCTRCTMHKPLFPGPPDPLCASKKACTRDEKRYSLTIMRVELLCMHFFLLAQRTAKRRQAPVVTCLCMRFSGHLHNAQGTRFSLFFPENSIWSLVSIPIALGPVMDVMLPIWSDCHEFLTAIFPRPLAGK
jgi:hypothetical protein